METQKERLYCLQTALKIAPENEAAKRGLILMGALAPDEYQQPFPMNHPRPWEEKIILQGDADKPKGFKGFIANPAVRVIGILIIGALLIGGAIFGFTQSSKLFPAPTRRIGPTQTFTPTVTLISSRQRTPTATFIGPTPLSALLDATFTPTPVYAATPHSGAMSDTYRGAKSSYETNNWTMFRFSMEQIATAESGAPDAAYFIAESYRQERRFEEAEDAFQEAIKRFPNFAPNYFGRALTKLAINPKNKVIGDINTAIQLDPLYIEAYIFRAELYMADEKFDLAYKDLQKAESLAPFSPTVYLHLAQIEIDRGNAEAALIAAQKANELDITALESYRLLGLAYQMNDKIEEAVGAFQTYVLYNPSDADAFMFLGSAYVNKGDYITALDYLDKAIALDDKSSQAFYWRGEAYYAREKYEEALADFRDARRWNAGYFEASVGVAKTYYAISEPNNTYAAITDAEKNIKTDQHKALFHYWSALSLEGMNEADAAYNSWRKLLELPETALNKAMQAEAVEHMAALRTPTPNPTLNVTETPAPDATQTPTANPTDAITITPAPSAKP